ncbi:MULTISPECIES: pyridoxamine 5'-phosphate oxidase family protein [unclassified Streptosporangium]|uniref:pyridoxamine 5'-phosphate oxidase family protein n=1 Tax=unclassified Streptosporangium TaxID=2632669 RepID=UPI002DDC820E|nr:MULTISPECIES: pyridoxamine 5'-phosphate oxidase family protein [unclassified Streptosporangium]
MSVEYFLAEPHVATLTTSRPDGSPHVVAVRFTGDGQARLARVRSAFPWDGGCAVSA